MQPLNLTSAKSIINHVISGEFSMENAPDEVKDNKKMALELLKSHHIKLNDFSPKLKDDEEIVFFSLKK